MSAMDEAILATFPVAAVAPSGSLLRAGKAGIRYLVGAAGLVREVTLPWITVRHCVAPTMMRLPYGVVVEGVDVHCAPIPIELVRQFTRHAKEASPVEVAAAFVWSSSSDSWRLEWRNARSSSSEHIEYDEVRLRDDEYLVVDAHSHGRWPAEFSVQDDLDDHGSMKFALVVGNLDQPTPTSAMRLCMAGVELPARLEEDGALVAITGRVA